MPRGPRSCAQRRPQRRPNANVACVLMTRSERLVHAMQREHVGEEIWPQEAACECMCSRTGVFWRSGAEGDRTKTRRPRGQASFEIRCTRGYTRESINEGRPPYEVRRSNFTRTERGRVREIPTPPRARCSWRSRSLRGRGLFGDSQARKYDVLTNRLQPRTVTQRSTLPWSLLFSSNESQSPSFPLWLWQ